VSLCGLAVIRWSLRCVRQDYFFACFDTNISARQDDLTGPVKAIFTWSDEPPNQNFRWSCDAIQRSYPAGTFVWVHYSTWDWKLRKLRGMVKRESAVRETITKKWRKTKWSLLCAIKNTTRQNNGRRSPSTPFTVCTWRHKLADELYFVAVVRMYCGETIYVFTVVLVRFLFNSIAHVPVHLRREGDHKNLERHAGRQRAQS